MTYFIMLGEVVVRVGDCSRCMDYINEAVSATCEKAMVDPNIRRWKDGNGISIGAPTMSNMCRTVPNKASFPRLTIMNTNPMYNNVANTLHRDAWFVCNLYFSTSTVYGLETIITSSFLGLIPMSFAKMIHSGLSSMTPYRSVHGLGFTGSSSELVTTYIAPYFPPIAYLPNPTRQSARERRLDAQLDLVRHHASITFKMFVLSSCLGPLEIELKGCGVK